jgi:hypothetical protein
VKQKIRKRGKSKIRYYDFIYKGNRHAGCIGQDSRTIAKEELARQKAEVAEVVEGKLNPAKVRRSPRFEVFALGYLEMN